MDTRCFLRTLGQPVLQAPSGDPLRIRVKKHLALLVFLAVELRVPHRRDRLADLLWPKASVAEGRHSLATALSVLRARLGRKALETTRETIRLTGTGLTVDLERLEAGDVLGDDVRPPLDVAGFLDGFELHDAEEFLRWKERQQARLLPAICKALVRLIDRCRRTADSRQMEHLADRMLVLDPLSEEGVRAKMEARVFAGDRLSALRVFEEWKEELARELGAVPSQLVEGIAIRLRRRGWERAIGDPIPAVRTEQWQGRPFIGRSAEYRVLYEAWERIQRGEPGHVLVRGDSGIGKSTLVERLSTAAGLEGAAVSRVQCYELEREIPYAAVTGLVLGLLDKPGASAAAPEALAELSRTVPEVRQRFPSIPPSVESHGETARVRLAEALHQLVEAIAEEHPAILVVDDLHLADDASLAVLHLVIRRAKGQPIMVVVTVRPGELGQAPQASRMVQAAPSLGFHTIEVGPMSEEESRQLLDALSAECDRVPRGAIRRALLDAAAGCPMVLELLMHDWHAHGDQSIALSIGAMTTDLEAGERGAAPYRHLFERMIASLDAPTRNVLDLAAILGRRLNDLEMYRLIDIGLGQTLASLTAVANLRVLRDGGRGLEFINELIRACAYQAIPSPARRLLHSSVADRLLNLRSQGLAVGGLEIAWHCMRACRIPEATPYLLCGAREAIAQGAPHEAERALTTGLPQFTARLKAEGCITLAEALQEQGRWSESLTVIESVPTTGLDEEQLDEIAVFRILAEYRTGALPVWHVDQTISRLAAILEGSSNARIQVRAASAAAVICSTNRNAAIARRVYQSVRARELRHLDDEQALRLELSQGMLAFQFGDLAAAESHLDSAKAKAQGTGIASSLAERLHGGFAALKVSRGDYAAALHHCLDADQAALRRGDEGSRVQAANIALCHARLGNLKDQIHWAAIAMTERHFPVTQCYTDIEAARLKALGHALRDERADALNALEFGERYVIEATPAWLVQIWGLFKADVFQTLGLAKEAYAIARRALAETNPDPPQPHFEGLIARWIALTATTPGELDGALNFINDRKRQLTQLDRFDQVEILAASMLVCRRMGSETEGDAAQLREILVRLPAAVTNQLQRLGMWG